MSVNITVNGKFGKRCNQPFTQLDPAQEKKELCEKRKQRLLQVREQSKERARRLREKVAREKLCQLQKCQQATAKDCGAWQTQTLTRMKQDFRACFTQVDAAHCAAIKSEYERLQASKHCRNSPKMEQPVSHPSQKLPRFARMGSSYYSQNLIDNRCTVPSYTLPQRSCLDEEIEKWNAANKTAQQWCYPQVNGAAPVPCGFPSHMRQAQAATSQYATHPYTQQTYSCAQPVCYAQNPDIRSRGGAGGVGAINTQQPAGHSCSNTMRQPCTNKTMTQPFPCPNVQFGVAYSIPRTDATNSQPESNCVNVENEPNKANDAAIFQAEQPHCSTQALVRSCPDARRRICPQVDRVYKVPKQSLTVVNEQSEQRAQKPSKVNDKPWKAKKVSCLKTQTTQTERTEKETTSKRGGRCCCSTAAAKVTIEEPHCPCCDSDSDQSSQDVSCDSSSSDQSSSGGGTTEEEQAEEEDEEEEQGDDEEEEQEKQYNTKVQNRGPLIDLDVDKDDIVTVTIPHNSKSVRNENRNNKCKNKSQQHRTAALNVDIDMKSDDEVTITAPSRNVRSTQVKKDKNGNNNIKQKTSKLRQTPAVRLDLDVVSDDIVTITTPHEVCDNHTEHNRQFSSIIRVSSPRRNNNDPNRYRSSTTENSSDSAANCSDEVQQQCGAKTLAPKPNNNKLSYNQSTIGTEDNSRQSANNPPRFTQISQLVQKSSTNMTQKRCNTDIAENNIVNDVVTSSQNATNDIEKNLRATETVARPITEIGTTVTTTIPPKSPSKKLSANATKSAAAVRASEFSTRTKDSVMLHKKNLRSPQKNAPKSPRGSVARSPRSSVLRSSALSAERVQFYDYNNKFTKAYEQPVDAVHKQPPHDAVQPNAMEQAVVEQQLQSARTQYDEDMRRKAEERGQKAFEREQVRRDCNELTQKLEALCKQHMHLLPSDSNITAQHRFVEAAARKEIKMNSAIEEILSRPAIITCPEVNQLSSEPNHITSLPKTTQADTDITAAAATLNLGAMPAVADHESSGTTSSDSCRSMLLGYVNDQSNQIRRDLHQCESNPNQQNQYKTKRLQVLLERIESLRAALIAELQAAGCTTNAANTQKVEEVIDSISAMRKEREHILIDDIAEKAIEPLQQREKVLQQKEAILENKIREFYKQQKHENGQSSKQRATENENARSKMLLTNADKPVEIIIKVCNATDSKNKKTKLPNRKEKSPHKMTKPVLSPGRKRRVQIATASNQKISNVPPTPHIAQHSYDSNSTSYRSLPQTITNKVAQQQNKTADANSAEEMVQTTNAPKNSRCAQTRLNPLVAHYVQRLLGMSRNSINALGVSSSEIETPSASVINTTTNRSDTEAEIVPRECMDRVQKFIEDNHCFIAELEESLRGSSCSENSLESTLKAFEEIWKQKLCEKAKRKQQDAAKATAAKPIAAPETRKQPAAAREAITGPPSISSKAGSPKRPLSLNKIISKRQEARGTKGDATAQQQQQKQQGIVAASQKQKPTKANAKEEKSEHQQQQQQRPTKKRNVTTNETPKKRRPATSDQSSETGSTQAQLDFTRYAQLTESCTHRIAELTELINKVREEKQKILGNTLSSTSENGCSSTEYIELPSTAEKTRSDANRSPDSGADDNTARRRQVSAATRLEKHKHTGTSRDSGISESRPHTAQEQCSDMADPPSVDSSNTGGTTSAAMRKTKPPPSLTRFPAQLVEDEVAHELSTIIEVDTPVTSRINTAAFNIPAIKITRATNSLDDIRMEEFAKKLNVDLKKLTPKQVECLQKEFENLLASLSGAQMGSELEYIEFPSLNAYLHCLGEEDPELVQSVDTMDDVLSCLGLNNPNISSFPNQSEYFRRNKNNTPVDENVDSVSVDDNFTAECVGLSTGSESTINIEEELKRRNILKSSFSRSRPTTNNEMLSSTRDSARKDNCAENGVHFGGESGIEKMSTSSPQSGDLERDLLNVGITWPSTMRKKSKELEQALNNSSTTPTTTRRSRNSYRNCAEKERSVSETSASTSTASKQKKNEDNSEECGGRPLGLRDFLTKELLKHHTSCTTSTSDNSSLKSNFLNSVIDTLTPASSPRSATLAAGNAGKTSTPIESPQSLPKSSQFFSGESRVSSVRYHRSKDHDECYDENAKNAE